MTLRFLFPVLAFAALPCTLAAQTAPSLAGTWTLVTAYEIKPDGSRTQNYGADARGILMIDGAGRYSLQIFRPGRPRFATGVKTKGTPDEYQQAVLGSSTHAGHVRLDPAKGLIIFQIELASFPNWEGTEQRRAYTFSGDTLSYQVPASASGNGTVAVSRWKREK
jgi:hypothetical protein